MRTKDPRKAQEIIEFIDSYYETYHSTPGVRMIAEHTTLGKSMVARYLQDLKDRGDIKYRDGMIITPRIEKFTGETTLTGILGGISCGTLEMEEVNVENFVYLPQEIFGRGELYILITHGESMTGAGIEDGDMVVIRKQETAYEDDIVVGCADGEGTSLKTLKRDRETGRMYLHPENPDFADIMLDEFRIQGVVVGIIRRTKAEQRG